MESATVRVGIVDIGQMLKGQILVALVDEGGPAGIPAPKKPRAWYTPGGSIKNGETDMACRDRETNEEGGGIIRAEDVKWLDPPVLFEEIPNGEGAVHYRILATGIYIGEPTPREFPVNDPDGKIHRWRWFTEEELEDGAYDGLKIHPRHAKMAKEAIRRVREYLREYAKVMLSKA